MSGIFGQLESFIRSENFFYYHGVVLNSLWIIGATIAILLRKVSKQLHALAFFLIDFITIFFIVGGLIRVYPYLGNFSQWSLIKQGHIAGGSTYFYLGTIFLVLLIIQHIGGVSTLLKGINYNPQHRKFAVVVSNFARILGLFGLILAGEEKNTILLVGAIDALLLVGSVYKVFIAGGESKKTEKSTPAQNSASNEASRQRSPPRDVKRD